MLQLEWIDDLQRDCIKGAELARTALVKGENDPAVLMIAGHTLAFLSQDYDTATALFDRSLSLNPNSSSAYERSGWVRC